DGVVLWRQTYDRKLADVLALQEEIARAIVGGLRIRLVADSERTVLMKHQTADLEAYGLFSAGSAILKDHNGPRDLQRSIQFFEQAIKRDSSYALAYARMSYAREMLAVFGYERAHDVFPRAKADARKALELDPTLAEAH